MSLALASELSTYDTLDRVTGLSSQPASYTYQRGPTGNLLSMAESSGRQVSWTYDGIYRLSNETISMWRRVRTMVR